MAADQVIFHHEAAAEYDAAFDWYLKRSPDAARRLGEEVERAFHQIIEGPKCWAPGPHGTRRYLLRHFPFLVIYREQYFNTIEIVAVAHTSRRPGYWRQRL